MRSDRSFAHALLALRLLSAAASAQELLTVDEALALAFPEAAVAPQVLALSADEQAAIGKAIGAPFARRSVVAHVARREGKIVGVAWLDTHVVRSHQQTLLVAVAGDGTIGRVEVLAFGEPRSYLPRPKWWQQFQGCSSTGQRQLDQVPAVAGATLTARAAQAACRRVLAVASVVAGRLTEAPEATGRTP